MLRAGHGIYVIWAEHLEGRQGVIVFFEEYPILLLAVILVVVEIWLRVREPLFHLISRAFGKGTSS